MSLIGNFIVVAVFLMALLFLSTLEDENRFTQVCIAKGGVPSKYSTMVAKTSRSERLCIKKDNVIEVGE
jgi:hypothetical protein